MGRSRPFLDKYYSAIVSLSVAGEAYRRLWVMGGASPGLR